MCIYAYTRLDVCDTALCCVPAAKFACAPSSIYGAWMKLKLARTVSLFGCHTIQSTYLRTMRISNIVAAKEAAPNLTHTTIVQFTHTQTKYSTSPLCDAAAAGASGCNT